MRDQPFPASAVPRYEMLPDDEVCVAFEWGELSQVRTDMPALADFLACLKAKEVKPETLPLFTKRFCVAVRGRAFFPKERTRTVPPFCHRALSPRFPARGCRAKKKKTVALQQSFYGAEGAV